MFEDQLGKNVEAYIDDMVVESKKESEHLTYLEEVFTILRKHKLRLNAFKCSLGVGFGKFLGYMITHRGIEVNLNQIKAIHNLHPPRNSKEVKWLTGMTAALNRFILRSADRYRLFFRLLHKWKDFTWSEECDKACKDLKAYLAHPLILPRPKKEEVLYAYIAVAQHAVSLVLIRVDEGIQKPVYYVNKSLQEAKVKYLHLKKAILAIIHATKKLDRKSVV